jgi:hypothetical protein
LKTNRVIGSKALAMGKVQLQPEKLMSILFGQRLNSWPQVMKQIFLIAAYLDKT